MTLVQHLERSLGPIAEGWQNPEIDHGVRVVRFAGKPYEGTSTFATLGVSQHTAELPDGRFCAQELLFATRDEYPSNQVASFLLTIAVWIRNRHQALLRGDVIGPSEPLIPGVATNSVYASMPVIFPAELATYQAEQGWPTVFVWLIPLLTQETQLVRSKGWSHFEDLLEQANMDLLDLNRSAIAFDD